MNILVRGKQVQVRVNGMLVVDYTGPQPPEPDGHPAVPWHVRAGRRRGGEHDLLQRIFAFGGWPITCANFK